MSVLTSSLLGKGLTSCLALTYPPLWQISLATALGTFMSKEGILGLCLSWIPELGLGTGIGLGWWWDGEGENLVGLSPYPGGSEAVSRSTVSELS